MSFAGKRALVTGASRGLGRAIAQRLARDGASVAINYVAKARDAESLADEIRRSGGIALPLRADVGDEAQVRSMVERIERELGPVDILVNNAGVMTRGDLEDFDYSGMEFMRRVNVDGLVHATRAVTAGMKQRGFGRIVNLTSIAAHGTAMGGTTFYAATKAAVSLLTRRFALELGPHGITVNAVAPGTTLTPRVRRARSPEDQARIAALIPLGRLGRPEDTAAAVAFLASDDAEYITGATLDVNGGKVMM